MKKQGARSSSALAATAVEAAKSQHTIVLAQNMGEGIVAALAKEILALNEELAERDARITEKVGEHQHAEALLSMPGFGPVLAAEFLGATGGDLTVFQSADRFAGVVGLPPAPRDSGRISGNHHRPRRYDRRLLRVFYLSGLFALKSCPASRGYYDRKRVEGKSHIQAMHFSCAAPGSMSFGQCCATARDTPLQLRRHLRWRHEQPHRQAQG